MEDETQLIILHIHHNLLGISILMSAGGGELVGQSTRFLRPQREPELRILSLTKFRTPAGGLDQALTCLGEPHFYTHGSPSEEPARGYNILALVRS